MKNLRRWVDSNMVGNQISVFGSGADEVWYRYVDYLVSSGSFDEWGESVGPSETRIRLEKYEVLKHTPKGVWIRSNYGDKKFILREARKRYACPTEAEAKISFIARKQRQIGIHSARIRHAKKALQLIKGKLCLEVSNAPAHN
jgi:hypothetical protein